MNSLRPGGQTTTTELLTAVRWLVACVALLTGSHRAHAEQPTTMSLADAVKRAITHDAQLKAANAATAAAEAEYRSVRGMLGPSIAVNASVNIWDSAFELPFAPGAPPTRLRDQLTTQLNLVATQPLAMQAVSGYKLGKIGAAIARSARRKTQEDVAYQTAKSYISLKQALAGLEIARAAVQQMKAQLARGKAFFSSGLIGKNDLLKLELGLAEAQTGEIRGEAALALARSALALAVSLPESTLIVPGERFADPPSAALESLESCVKRALRQRSDRRAAEQRIGQAEQARNLAFWNLGPNIALVANYQNVQGQGLLMPKDMFFVGGTLHWNLWNWGSEFYVHRQRKAQVEQARQGLALVERMIVLEVKQAYLQLNVARQVLAVEAKRIAQAEEALRIEQAKFEKQAATTRDLLDAQLALTRARQQRNNALYGFYLARAALRVALGQTVGLENER
ncbi:MAG: TolC family protein [Deltaproteobacteria bacterium]|nr:TolC family protein [Deltaproteobacteria bacterium]